MRTLAWLPLRRRCGGRAGFRRFDLRRLLQIRSLFFKHDRSARFLDGKSGDDLRLPVVQQPEVIFGQVAHGVAIAVAHHYGYGHQVHPRLEFRGRFLGFHFGGGLALGRGLLRQCKRARQKEERK